MTQSTQILHPRKVREILFYYGREGHCQTYKNKTEYQSLSTWSLDLHLLTMDTCKKMNYNIGVFIWLLVTPHYTTFITANPGKTTHKHNQSTNI